MRFEELVTVAADLHCFSPGMVTAGEDIDSIRVQLSRWVTTGRPLSIDTPIGRLAYHHIKKELFFGYRQEDGNTQHSYIASPEKALLDLFYFTPGSGDASYIAELRLQNFDAVDPEKLAAMAEHTRLPGIRRTIQLLLEYMK